jgi:hypothetical protein
MKKPPRDRLMLGRDTEVARLTPPKAGTPVSRVSAVKMTGAEMTDSDEILPEYDFRHASRNPFASQYAAGSAVVVLDPDVAAAFPSAEQANEALRALAGIIQKHRRMTKRARS